MACFTQDVRSGSRITHAGEQGQVGSAAGYTKIPTQGQKIFLRRLSRATPATASPELKRTT